MTLSVLDLFTIGIGPSSSHTVGPMRAGMMFVQRLVEAQLLARVARVEAHLYGSLALTGKGHGTDTAVVLGLEGETPEGIDTDAVPARLASIRAQASLQLGGTHAVAFVEKRDVLFHRHESLPGHPNGLRFYAFDASGTELLGKTYYSVGAGSWWASWDCRATRHCLMRLLCPFPGTAPPNCWCSVTITA